jgi:FtsP/CotA-like multicopper oxidase with cupredoxin domain
MTTTRRQFLTSAGALAGVASLAKSATAPAADITLRIAETTVELGPKRSVKTLTYNGKAPGPLLRMTEGKPVTIEAINETRSPEMIHWHGFHIPPEVDGAHEEGTPMIQGTDRRTYTFTPQPAGTRWYHTHAMAGHNLKVGLYSGQFGMVVVEPRVNPARYDLDVPIIFHEWEPSFASGHDMDVSYRYYSINGKMLGAGEPVRVKPGQKVLFRVLNASATTTHRLALAGHKFRVMALDGNAVAKPQSVPVLMVAPGERVDALVEMNNPGVWVFGEEDKTQRAAGAGIAVEYAGMKGPAKWIAPPAFEWDYCLFGEATEPEKAEASLSLVITPGGNGNLWAINGKSWPDTDEILLGPGIKNRLIFDNRGDMDHPFHLHRHTFELVRVAGKPVAGVSKDVVNVPAHKVVEVDVMAGSPGPSLFHCHQQFHMDFGFMALLKYRNS